MAPLALALGPMLRPTPTRRVPTLRPRPDGQAGVLAFGGSSASLVATAWAVLGGAFEASGAPAGEVVDDGASSVMRAKRKGGES
jgi:hypothetical protein